MKTYDSFKTFAFELIKSNFVHFHCTECLIEVKPGEDVIYFVDAVIDSSRYYVLRLQDRMSTRSLLVGIGFRERDTSFDFKNCLNDYVRYVDRMAAAEKSKAMWTEQLRESDGIVTSDIIEKGAVDEASSLPISRHRDLSIPAGQKIIIKSRLLKNTDTKYDEQGTMPVLPKMESRQSYFAPPPQVKATGMSLSSGPLILNKSPAVYDAKDGSEIMKDEENELEKEKEKEKEKEEEEEEEGGDFDSASTII